MGLGVGSYGPGPRILCSRRAMSVTDVRMLLPGADLGPMSDSEDDEESDEDEMEGSIDDEEEEEEDEEDDDEDMMGGMHFGRVGESGNRLVKARVVKGESEEIEEILTPVRLATALCARYPMPGTDRAYGAIPLRARYAMPGTHLA
eukprot:1098067-Rhodomonas_salina.1